MLEGKGGVRELVTRLQEMDATASDAGREEVTLERNDLERLLDFVDKAVAAAESANELLVHSYSMPDDERGVRFISEDAVKLQWALREIGIGDDSGQPCFTV